MRTQLTRHNSTLHSYSAQLSTHLFSAVNRLCVYNALCVVFTRGHRGWPLRVRHTRRTEECACSVKPTGDADCGVQHVHASQLLHRSVAHLACLLSETALHSHLRRNPTPKSVAQTAGVWGGGNRKPATCRAWPVQHVSWDIVCIHVSWEAYSWDIAGIRWRYSRDAGPPLTWL